MLSVSIVTTVLNDAAGCRVLLDSLADQIRQPDEFIVVDGGSTDGTPDVVRAAALQNPRIRLIEAPGVNIGAGRNTGIRHATGCIIASTDTGCRLDPHWLEKIIEPFEDERNAEFVAGFYEIDPHTLLERVIGTSTMRGALDPVCPDRFNPSGRSMAFTKSLWERAGGIPQFLAIDDTLFDAKIRSMNVRWVFAGDAVVHWRPRGTFRSLARQFAFYGTSAGHTQMDAGSSLYNIRNLLVMIAMIAAACFADWGVWLVPAIVAAFGYFYVHTFHQKSSRVMKTIGDWRAYFLALAVQWTIVISDAYGYVVGSLQRVADRRRYRDGLRNYMRIGGSTVS